MKRNILCLLMVCLFLTGCGKTQETAEPSRSPLSAAADMDPDAVLLCIDGADQPAWRYLYWLARACGQLQTQYEQAGQTVDWTAPLEEGGTLADYVKEQALTDTALYAVVEQWAEIYGCVPEELPETAASADTLLTAEQAAQLADIGRAYGELYAQFCTPDSLLAPVEGELALFAQQEGYLRIDRILVSGQGDREAARQKAADLFAQLNSAADKEETFQALARAGDDPAGPRIPESGTFDRTLLEAAKTLEEGQYSGILESAEGFSILRRLPVDEKDLHAAYFDYLLQAAAEKCEIRTTEAYQTLSVSDFAAALYGQKRR